MLIKIKQNPSFDIRLAYFLLFLLLLPTCIYLNNELIWDDQFIIRTHAAWSFKTLFGPYAINSSSYWRPLAVLSIVLPYLAGLPIWMCKLLSLGIFYVQGCLAIQIVAFKLKARQPADISLPIIAITILMGLHPVFVETILWMSARADLLVGTFVLLGICWLLKIRELEQASQSPESNLKGLLRGFALIALICVSKDTGIVWAGLGALSLLYCAATGNGAWKKYWWYCAFGAVCAAALYLALRTILLGSLADLDKMALHHAGTPANQLRFFCEFIWRSVLGIFAPSFDPAPFKSAGWFDSATLATPLFLMLAVLLALGFALRRLSTHNQFCAWLLICAASSIGFHAVIETFVEPTFGSTLAARYLAPGAALIFIAMALAQFRSPKPEQMAAQRGMRTLLGNVPAIVLLVMIGQSIVLWPQIHASWSTNGGLWKYSWEAQSRAKIVASNYSLALLDQHQFAQSRVVAEYWVDSHPQDDGSLKLCAFYDVLLKDSISVNDNANAIRLAQKALPIGWCAPDLGPNIAFVLMKQQCRQLLPVLSKAIDEGDKPVNAGMWQYENIDTRIRLLSVSAYAEARCGSDQRAMELLRRMEKLDAQWTVSGPLAQSLLKGARTAP